MTDTKLSIHEIELAVAQAFGIRNNIIVPNVSWGFFATHEADLVIINKSGYMTEVEIKRSWQDFLNDFKKHTTHDEGKVMWKYFAVPQSLCEKAWQYLCTVSLGCVNADALSYATRHRALSREDWR